MKRTAFLVVMAVMAAGAAFASGEEEEYQALRDVESVSGIDSVIVDAGTCDVEVSVGGGSSVSIESESPGNSFFDEPRGWVIRQRMGSQLRIQVTRDMGFGSGSGRLRLRVPRGVDLKVKTRSGRISVEGLEDGACDVSTLSGRVLLKDIRGDVIIDSVSGDVTLDSIEGRLNVKTVSGSIGGRQVLFTEDAELTAVSGNIDIRLENPEDDLSFDLSSVSGRIVIGSIRAEKGLRMGFGGTTIRGHTVSGSLVFR